MALRPRTSGAGPNAGDEVAERVILQALNLERLKADEVKKVLSILEDLSKDLAEKIKEADPTGVGPSTYRQRRMAALFDQINRTIKGTYRQLNKETTGIIKGVVDAEAKAAALAMNAGAYSGVTLAGLPTTAQLQAIASEALIMGSPSKEWWGQQAGDLENRFKTQIRQGMVLGEGVDDLVARIRGTQAANFADGIMNLPKHRAEALVRSSVQAASNAARLNTFEANRDLLNGYQWVSTLDGRTSDTCKARSGLRWDLDFNPVGHDKTWSPPPAHWNCRSTVIPWLKSFADLSKTGKVLKRTKGEKLDSYFQKALLAMGIKDAANVLRNTKASLNGQVAGDINYEAWLKSKSSSFQKEVLGETRFNLLAEGKISLLDLVDQSSNPITLQQLQDLVDQGKVSLIKFDKKARKDAIEAAKAKAKQAKVVESAEDDSLQWLVAWPKEKKFNQNAYDKAKKQEGWDELTAQQRKTLVLATYDDMQQKYWQSAAANKLKNGKKLGKKEQKFWDSADPDYKAGVMAQIAKSGEEEAAALVAKAEQEALEKSQKFVNAQAKALSDDQISTILALQTLTKGGDEWAKGIIANIKFVDPEDFDELVKNGQLGDAVVARMQQSLLSTKNEIDVNLVSLADAEKIDISKVFKDFLDYRPGEKTKVGFAGFVDFVKGPHKKAIQKQADEFTKTFNELVEGTAATIPSIGARYIYLEEAKLTRLEAIEIAGEGELTQSYAKTMAKIVKGAAAPQIEAFEKIVEAKKKVYRINPELEAITTEKAEEFALQSLVKIQKEAPNVDGSVKKALVFLDDSVSSELVFAKQAEKTKADLDALFATASGKAADKIEDSARKYQPEIKEISQFIDDKLPGYQGSKQIIAEDLVAPYTIEQTPGYIDLLEMDVTSIKSDFLTTVDQAMDEFLKLKIAVKKANAGMSSEEATTAALVLVKKYQKKLKDETGFFQGPSKIIEGAKVEALEGGLADALQAEKKLAAKRAKGLVFEDFNQIGGQGGSNVGGLFESTLDGQKFYIKAPDSEIQAKIEILSSKLYKMAGVRAAEVSPIQLSGKLGKVDVDGRLGVASKIEDITDIDAKGIAALNDVQDGFAADAWLANWDVIGNGGPSALNIKRLADGSAFRIDTGATMMFRAQGGRKAFSASEVLELNSLRVTDDAQRLVFGDISDAKIVQGVARIVQINDDDIRKIVKEVMGDDAGDIAETLIGRKAFLAKKYKKELAALNKPAKRKTTKALQITPEEYTKIEAGRGNGYSQLRDKDKIEDQEVLFWNYTDEGVPGGGIQFKVRKTLSSKLTKEFDEVDFVFSAPKLDTLDDRFLKLIKSLSARSAKGDVILNRHYNELEDLASVLSEKRREITEAIKDGYYNQQVLDDFDGFYKPWLDDIQNTLYSNNVDEKFVFTPSQEKFDVGAFRFPKAATPQKSTSLWSKGRTQFYEADIQNGNLDYKAPEGFNVLQADHFKADVDSLIYQDDDFLIRYVPRSNRNVALRDLVDVRFKNPSPERYESAMQKLKELGIDLSEATEQDIELAYLEKYLNLFDIDKDAFVTNSIESGIIKTAKATLKGVSSASKKIEVYREAVREILEIRTGQKIDNLLDFPGYKPLGKKEYWGDGRTFFERPDLFGDKWDEFTGQYVLRHDFEYGGGYVVDTVRNILNGGGVMAPTLDKLRRGVRISGASPGRDLESGGAAYNFTRLRTRSALGTQQGIFWKPKLLRRLDAITYDQDWFGKTVSGRVNFVKKERYTSIEGFKYAEAYQGNNETIFKNSISIFEDVIVLNVVNQRVKSELIDVFREAGYERWPDGRSFDEVIKVTGEYVDG